MAGSINTPYQNIPGAFRRFPTTLGNYQAGGRPMHPLERSMGLSTGASPARAGFNAGASSIPVGWAGFSPNPHPQTSPARPHNPASQPLPGMASSPMGLQSMDVGAGVQRLGAPPAPAPGTAPEYNQPGQFGGNAGWSTGDAPHTRAQAQAFYAPQGAPGSGWMSGNDPNRAVQAAPQGPSYVPGQAGVMYVAPPSVHRSGTGSVTSAGGSGGLHTGQGGIGGGGGQPPVSTSIQGLMAAGQQQAANYVGPQPQTGVSVQGLSSGGKAPTVADPYTPWNGQKDRWVDKNGGAWEWTGFGWKNLDTGKTMSSKPDPATGRPYSPEDEINRSHDAQARADKGPTGNAAVDNRKAIDAEFTRKFKEGPQKADPFDPNRAPQIDGSGLVDAINAQAELGRGRSIRSAMNAGARSGMSPEAMIGQTADIQNQTQGTQVIAASQSRAQTALQNASLKGQAIQQELQHIERELDRAQDDKSRAELMAQQRWLQQEQQRFQAQQIEQQREYDLWTGLLNQGLNIVGAPLGASLGKAL